MPVNAASNSHAQPANVVMQQPAARQPIVKSTVFAGGILDTVEHAASHVIAPDSAAAADLVQGSHIAAAAEADPVFVSHDAAATEVGSALGSPEAAAAEGSLAHDNQEAAAGEADAATMAAWLIQKPSLLQGVLGHLESLAASTLLKSSAPTPYSNAGAGWPAGSSAGNTLSAVSACDTLASATTWIAASPWIPQSGVEASVATPAGWCRWDLEWQSVYFASSFC